MVKTGVYFVVMTAMCMAVGAAAQDLVILHTNDTHSQMEVLRTGSNKGKGGVHRRAEYFSQVKSQHENVLILDAGDYNQGTPYFTIFRGDMEIEIMNALGYDVVALGNHEFDNGQEELARRLSKAEFQTVCANYDFSGTPLEKYIKPYVILDRGGKRIGIFGLTTNLSTVVASSNIKGMTYRNPVEVADKMADLLKNEKKCDLVIALTHIGYSGYPDQASDVSLAKSTSNIDFIIGGHSHTYLESETVCKNKDGKDVIVVQDGSQGVYVGRLDIDFK